jgi:hypothetical protein
MMDDIRSGKDGVSFVLVFKLSRFGRNAADVLSALQVMQDYGVNLICVEDGIDSSKDAGKLMISVLSAVAEIERENIRVQTMEGRMQKAREGRWNGGFAPYGYELKEGKLYINEEEAEAIRVIFDKYVNTDMGANFNKDIFDMYFLSSHVDVDKFKKCLGIYVYNDSKMREIDIDGIVKRVNMVFKDKSYTSRLRTKDANWLGVDSEVVTKGLIDFLKQL